MAACATRSAGGSGDDDSRSLLVALSHDELGVIVDGLADPLQPGVAVALSSTCLGLRTPLFAALQVLQARHGRAVALCLKIGETCETMRASKGLMYYNDVTPHDLTTLGMIMRTNGLPKLQRLNFYAIDFGDAGMQALFEGVGRGSAPSLRDSISPITGSDRRAPRPSPPPSAGARCPSSTSWTSAPIPSGTRAWPRWQCRYAGCPRFAT